MTDSIIKIEVFNVRRTVHVARLKKRLFLRMAAMALVSLVLIFTALVQADIIMVAQIQLPDSETEVNYGFGEV